MFAPLSKLAPDIREWGPSFKAIFFSIARPEYKNTDIIKLSADSEIKPTDSEFNSIITEQAQYLNPNIKSNRKSLISKVEDILSHNIPSPILPSMDTSDTPAAPRLPSFQDRRGLNSRDSRQVQLPSLTETAERAGTTLLRHRQ
ncbi:MAG: hypothetical protein OXC95_13770 [Dehalococcoidia bacterium]|nr:hypothetical protein [Dehalococcoidia bacterium]